MTTQSAGPAGNALHRIATHKAMLQAHPADVRDLFHVVPRPHQRVARQGAAGGRSRHKRGRLWTWRRHFLLGYALLEVPSNLAAHRVGPRRWIARIAVTWGALSASMMFVQGEWSFYVIRVLLGIAEAGLFPALMYMVTLWFAPKDRPVAVGWIYTAPALALVIGNPLGGALMQLNGIGGLHGWQWMFILEGLPTILVGVVLFFKLPEAARACWLSREEARLLRRTRCWMPCIPAFLGGLGSRAKASDHRADRLDLLPESSGVRRACVLHASDDPADACEVAVHGRPTVKQRGYWLSARSAGTAAHSSAVD